jgi:PAS domain S-box-containing protein
MPEISAATPSPSEHGLRADQLLDTLPWGLLEVSAAGTIRHLNRQAAAWWGVPVGDALGQPIDQVGPGQLPTPIYAALRQATSRPTKVTECYLPQSEQWVTLTSARQPMGELLVYWQDITPQKQREQQYQALAENTPDVLTRWDPALRLLYANAAFAAKAGQPLSALLGHPFTDMGLPAEITGPYQAVLQRVFDTGQPQEHYNIFPGPHGPIHYHSRLVPELRDGQLETVLGIARDISELKRTEAETLRLREALKQQATDRYQALLYVMDEGFCVVELTFDDGGQQVVDYVYRELNTVFAQQSGLPAEALGKSVRELLPDLEPTWFDIYGRVARTGEAVRLEHQVPQLDRWFELHACRVGAAGSRQVAVLFNDITERKHTEATLRRAAEAETFRLHLADALRPLTDAVAIQQAALQLVGELLRLDRVLYNEINSDVTTYTVRASYVREGFLAYGGQQPMGPFTESVRALQQGLTKVVYDVETDESFSAEERAICASIQVRAFVVVPLVKEGQWLINLVAHASQPRPWPAHEVALLEETAERTWAAVERAKAVEALRNSEAQLHSFVTASSDSLYRMDADWQHMQTMLGNGFLAPTEAPNATWLTQYIPPPTQPAVQAAVKAAIAGRHFFELEHHVFRADGSIGWAFSRAVPILDSQGELVEWFGTATDITSRKLAEAARHESEERLQTLVENLPGAAVFVVDANLRYLVAEGDALHQAGLRPGDLLGRTVREALPPELWALHEAHYRAALAGQPFALEHAAHGRAFATRGVPLRQAAGQAPAVLAVSYDITERKRAEDALRASEAQLVEFNAQLERQVARRTQALQESQQLLQSVYDTTLVGLAALHAVRDEATGAITDFTFISTNKELARLSGRPDLVGRRYGQVFPDRRPSGVRNLMVQAVETGQPQQSEFSYAVAGVPRWVAFMCVKLGGGVVATLLDITTRKHTEQLLTRNLHLLEQAETVAQLGSWDYDLATGQFHWSAGMYQLFELPQGQPVVPSIYLHYVLAADLPLAERLVQRLTTGTGDFETTLRLQMGEAIKTVRVKAVVLRDTQGQAVRVLGVDLNISELHRLEADNLRLRLSQQQALFEAVQAAEEAERRRMSESLHNGIGQILYATKLQLDRLPAASPLSPQRRAADLLGEAIRQTRTLSHELTPAILEQFGLEKTLRSICSTLHSPGLRWHCYFVFEEARPLSMPLQLAVYRLVQELAQNVLKHAQATAATLEVEVLPAWLVLRVEDNGRGFDPAQISDGLGLRSLRSRVALLGGSVHLTTLVDHGTQCQIRLPLPP